jgi:hypothetical protein
MFALAGITRAFTISGLRSMRSAPDSYFWAISCQNETPPPF